jgi:hypothetical protein
MLRKKSAALAAGYTNYVLAGEVGIEPTNAGIKIRCLTTWRLPIIGFDALHMLLSSQYCVANKISASSSLLRQIMQRVFL